MTSRLDRVLVLALVVVMILTVTTILLSTRATADRATLAQMEQVMTRVAFEASDEAGAFLDPAASLARLSADLLEDGVFDESEPERLEEFLIDVLRENSLLAGLFVGRPDGDFFYVNRSDEWSQGGFRTKAIDVTPTSRAVSLLWRDASGAEVAAATDPDDDYDPRTRPWYVGAAAAGRYVWTDPYIFFSSRQPGITASAPIGTDGEDDGGALTGVFGVDVEVRELSTILSSLPISEEGQAFIVDASGQLVGVSLAVELGLEDGNTLRRLTPAELTDPDIRQAYATLLASGGPLVDGPMFVEFTSQGRPWRASFERFANGQWPWTIAVVAPEDDFLEEVRETQAANTRLAIIVGLIATLLAVALTTGLTRPLAKMRRSVEVDQLTGLGNRRRLERQGQDVLETAVARGTSTGVAMLDLDHFKAVNDSYGHNVGDEVLKAVSGRMRRALRDEDMLIRQGGEEFVVILPDTAMDEAVRVLERLLAGIRGAPINTSAGPIPATISAGLVVGWPRKEHTTRELVGRADQSLYEAKRGGRDNLVAVALGAVGAEA